MASQTPQRGAAEMAVIRDIGALADRRRSPGRGRLLFPALALLCGVAALPLLPDAAGPARPAGASGHGGPLLETAFVLAVLVAAVLTFRTLEVLFRFAGVRPMRALPIGSGAFASTRLRALASEAAQASGLLALLFVPFVPFAPAQASAAMLLATTAPPMAIAISLGANVFAGVATLRPDGPTARRISALTGDSTGAWHMAPGAAFTLTAMLLLVAKLGIEELLRPLFEPGLPAVTRAAMVALALAWVPALWMGVRGHLRLRRHALALLARFEEGDAVRRDAATELFAEQASAPGWIERRLPPRIALLHRKDRLLLERGSPFLRAGTGALAALLLLVRWAAPEALPAAGWAAVAGGWLILVFRPHQRLLALDPDDDDAPTAALASRVERGAARIFAAANVVVLHGIVLSAPLLLTGGSWGMRLAALGTLWTGLGAALIASTALPGPVGRYAVPACWLGATAVCALFGPGEAVGIVLLPATLLSLSGWALAFRRAHRLHADLKTTGGTP
ncbi:MAG: hypothetical protein EA398_05940 [Deltaproteobacteria bacterium]|nr:MAG: hypothetical protein EA398_05940 [Deltaproteobacteria bacterium]